MKLKLDKIYQADKHEDNIYQKWENSGFFNPDNLGLSPEAPTYTIILPPPNITAKLHAGHSYMLAIEDLLIRFHRLRGYRALWLPGTDHAAIATQNVVEKKIWKETGKTRHDLGKSDFLQKVDKFVAETQSTILRQTKKMGASLDWSRLAFTLDEQRQKAVRTMFVDMYREGIIYQGERVVNWCPRCQSTLADDEVEYKEQKAKLYTFKYDQDFPLSISTTRPETKLGDTAVAVNPQDKRYQKYIGKNYHVDFCGQSLNIKIIADRQVDKDFGTGVLGVTPAHSLVDWQMAQSEDLPIKKVIGEDGKIKKGYGSYSGLTALKARQAIVEELKKRGLLEREEDITNNLSICYRCSTPIEPLPSKQWFVSVDKKLNRLQGLSLKEKALEVLSKKQIEFIPDRFGKRYYDWMNNLHDWCISRQIWYGHQIPVWYCQDCGEITVAVEEPASCSSCGSKNLVQDQDTLDTWFSSGMWTFSTLGWPDNFSNAVKKGDLAKFHPTQLLETGYEIITLWVSRMIMMSFFALGEIPFEKVYLHGTVLDKFGKKMSKSKGNGIDPLEIIKDYGADALRLALLSGGTPGNDLRYSEDKVAAKRNLINKLWNVSRFILSLSDKVDRNHNHFPTIKTLADRWIIQELTTLIRKTTDFLETLNFSLASEELQEFTWNKLADWYLEIAKAEGDKGELLLYILKTILILWHPFIPFVTEEIWSSFNDSFLMMATWPSSQLKVEIKDSEIVNTEFKAVQEVITTIRNMRSANKIAPSQKLPARIYGHNLTELLISQKELIKKLRTGLSDLEIIQTGDKVEGALAAVVGEVEIYLLEASVEQNSEELLKNKENLEKMIELQELKLANSEFVNKAPAKIVELEKNKLSGYQMERDKIIKILEQL